jgi:hypothetical protein
MKIPKYIDKLIDRRSRLASALIDVCGELDDWLEKNGVDTEMEDTRGGVEIYVNPYSSAERIRQAIREAGVENGSNRDIK